jgi:hypothetical protein
MTKFAFLRHCGRSEAISIHQHLGFSTAPNITIFRVLSLYSFDAVQPAEIFSLEHDLVTFISMY